MAMMCLLSNSMPLQETCHHLSLLRRKFSIFSCYFIREWKLMMLKSWYKMNGGMWHVCWIACFSSSLASVQSYLHPCCTTIFHNWEWPFWECTLTSAVTFAQLGEVNVIALLHWCLLCCCWNVTEITQIQDCIVTAFFLFFVQFVLFSLYYFYFVIYIYLCPNIGVLWSSDVLCFDANSALYLHSVT